MDRETDGAPVAPGHDGDDQGHDRLDTHSSVEATAAAASAPPAKVAQATPDAGNQPAETSQPHALNVPQPNAPISATFTSSDGAKIALPEGATVDTIWVSAADAITYISNLTLDFTTNYDAALNDLMSNWGTPRSVR